jgi:hypothetical protein
MEKDDKNVVEGKWSGNDCRDGRKTIRMWVEGK